jgi:putative glutathione S-transferase
MGMMIDGAWQQNPPPRNKDGRFVRKESVFRDRVAQDGSTPFKAEAGRYHLYVCYACPWAHRTMIFRALKGLEEVIGLSAVEPVQNDEGWEFNAAYPDPLYGLDRLHQLYGKVEATYTGRITVPVLWDKQTGRIVNNESSEIIRMLNSEFNGFAKNPELDLHPAALHGAIKHINDLVYGKINNGVYRTGFASTQEAYEEAFDDLFGALDDLEEILGRQKYLTGNRITEADWRLFPTLIRFDAVYAGHFKCNKRRIVDYPNLWNYLRELYQIPGVAGTVHMDHIKDHYYMSHPNLNPTRIVPRGPELDFTLPHDRGENFGETDDRNYAA